MLVRDIPGFGIYFGSFEAFKTLLRVHDGQPDGMGYWSFAFRKFLSGGLSGVVTWTIAFPADAIKTKM